MKFIHHPLVIIKLTVILFGLSGLLAEAEKGPQGLASGETIVVVGDSFSFQGNWPSWADYVAAYLQLGNPDKLIHFATMARSGASIDTFCYGSGAGNENYPMWVAPYSPNYVMSMWADNGGYTKEQYRQAIKRLIDEHIAGQNKAKPILVGTMPTPTILGYPNARDYDDVNQELAEAASPPYEYVKTWQALERTYTYLGAVAFQGDAATDRLISRGHGLVDGDRVTLQWGSQGPGGTSNAVYYYVVNATTDNFQITLTKGGTPLDLTTNGGYPNYVSKYWALYAIAPGNTHPSTASSIITAWKVITGLGWDTTVSQASIKANILAVTSQTDCVIRNVVANSLGGIDFERLDEALPWAIDESFSPYPDLTPATGRTDARNSYPEMAGWQKYMLTVTGLEAGTYDVLINGVNVAAVTDAELSAGWNMADLTSGPVWEKEQQVLARYRIKQGVDPKTLVVSTGGGSGIVSWKSLAKSLYTSGIDQTVYAQQMAKLRATLDELDASIKAAAQPEVLNFSLRRQQAAVAGGGGLNEKGQAPMKTTGLRLGGSSWVPPTGVPAPSFGIKEIAPARPAAWPSAAAAGNLYIDNTDPSATDINNVYGYPNKPRLTIPSAITLKAGSLVEIHGGPYLSTLSTYAYRFNSDPTTPPTVDAPAFVRGIGMPFWGQTDATVPTRLEMGVLPGAPLAYTIVEGIKFNGFTAGFTGNGTHHVCIRNCESSEQIGDHRSVMNVSPPANGVVHDVVFYNNHLHHTSEWNNTAADYDQHGISISTITRSAPTEMYNIWVLDNEIDHVSGDSVQITGGVNGHSILHNVYIGRNNAHHNRQSGFWCKEASDVIVSQNVAHDMTASAPGLSAYGFGSQYGPNRIWFLFNEAYNCGTGFGQSDSTGASGDSNEYYIGNYIHDLNQSNLTYSNWSRPMGWAFQFTQGVLTRHVVDNTAVNVFGGIFCHNPGPLVFHNNTINNILPNTAGVKATTSAYNKHIDLDFTAGVTFSRSHFYGVQGQSPNAVYTNFNGSAYTTLAAAQAGGKLTDSIGGDALLTDGKPGPLSPLIDAGTESDVYGKFLELYGIDIRKDIHGVKRPAGAAWDIGASEYVPKNP